MATSFQALSELREVYPGVCANIESITSAGNTVLHEGEPTDRCKQWEAYENCICSEREGALNLYLEN